MRYFVIAVVAMVTIAGCKKESVAPEKKCAKIINIETLKNPDNSIESYRLTLADGRVIMASNTSRNSVGNDYCE